MNTLPAVHAVAPARATQSFASYDALVIVTPTPIARHAASFELPGSVVAAIESSVHIDQLLAKSARTGVVLAAPDAPGGRLVLAPMGAMTDDTDDVRIIAETVASAVSRAVDAGARKPLLAVVAPPGERYRRAVEVATVAALGTCWSPIEAREAGRSGEKLTALGVVGLDPSRKDYIVALEAGRSLCRDITGTDPERAAPLRVAEMCEAAFVGTRIAVRVERDVTAYPLMSAVARASMRVERHRPCIVRLEFTPDGPATKTLWIAAKGVTYDTGGADLKTDGSMAGMSRDKGGAGAAAGLMRVLADAQPKGVRVVALLGLVRNSIGADSYVSDEVITGRSGVRVRIGNTDAEGRLVLADLLASLRDEAARAPEPTLMSIATLTGHVYRAFGPYVGALENAPARARGVIEAIATHGDAWGEPMEWTLPRREDYALVAAKSAAEDVVSSNRLASVNTPRGHQAPFAFLDIASGLRGGALPFVHLDIAGVAVAPADWQAGRPTGTPVVTLSEFVMNANARSS